MTHQEIYEKEHGEKGWGRLDPRIKKIFKRIDSLPPLSEKPITSRDLQQAFK